MRALTASPPAPPLCIDTYAPSSSSLMRLRSFHTRLRDPLSVSDLVHGDLVPAHSHGHRPDIESSLTAPYRELFKMDPPCEFARRRNLAEP